MNNYPSQNKDSTIYMNVIMVSEYLHVAKSTIYKWVEEDYIPHKKLRKRLIFIKNDIDQWVENNGMIIDELPEIPKVTSDEVYCELRNFNRETTKKNELSRKYRIAG